MPDGTRPGDGPRGGSGYLLNAYSGTDVLQMIKKSMVYALQSTWWRTSDRFNLRQLSGYACLGLNPFQF
ncbi:hypothetical protein [Desulfonatronospira sp.]|uniref:hypothetical protein n=1 Tax=Desulfonatronospira sp. TaxID=1962951 RepID=UPI0025C0775D|nr:hypothetical protein [Desulfonatronospira sp.]